MYSKKMMKHMIKLQKHELTDHIIYKKLAEKQKNERNRKILEKISEDEYKHYEFWKSITKKEIKPSRLEIWLFFFIARFFGLTFGIRLKEKGEEKTQYLYSVLRGKVSGIEELIEDEEVHEDQLIDAIEEEGLNYIGSVVLGLNDALVELTGALAGLTFGLAGTGLARFIAFSGFITGIAASFSMASSEYLSAKQDHDNRFAIKSAMYTGVAYFIAVILLILPYLALPTGKMNIFGLAIDSVFVSLLLTIVIAIFIIFLFNFYISVAKKLNFKRRFLEMVTISLSVALISFLVGHFVGKLFDLPMSLS